VLKKPVVEIIKSSDFFVIIISTSTRSIQYIADSSSSVDLERLLLRLIVDSWHSDSICFSLLFQWLKFRNADFPFSLHFFLNLPPIFSCPWAEFELSWIWNFNHIWHESVDAHKNASFKQIDLHIPACLIGWANTEIKEVGQLWVKVIPPYSYFVVLTIDRVLIVIIALPSNNNITMYECVFFCGFLTLIILILQHNIFSNNITKIVSLSYGLLFLFKN